MKLKLISAVAIPAMLSACGSVPSNDNAVQFGDVVAVALQEVQDQESGKTTVVAETTKERAEVSVADIGSEALMSVQRYIPVGQDFENYAVSSDGRVVVSLFNQEGQDGMDVWVYGPGKMRVTKTGHFNYSPSFSADGSKIYFSSKRGRLFWDEYDQSHYIWRVPAQGGGGITRIGYAAHEYAGMVSESPDGEQILYASREIGSSDSFIWMSNVQGTMPTQLAAGHSPSWLDNDTILFVAPDPNTQLDAIWSRSTDGSQLTQLVVDPNAHCMHAAASPDGRYVAYVKQDSQETISRNRRLGAPRVTEEETRDVFIYDMQTGLSQQMTTNASRDDLPHWAADGSSLLFRSTRGLGWNIWRVSAQSVAAM